LGRSNKNALAEASKTIKNIKSIYVKNFSANVENNQIVEYKANVKISFVVGKEL
jgi:flavin-binding protein dodecin